MVNLVYRNMATIGAPSFDEEARAFGRAIKSNLGIAAMDDQFTADNQRLTPPTEFEAIARRSLPPFHSSIPAPTVMWNTAGTRRRHSCSPGST
jgi:aminobenzoyl-glutamate utilization protein B